MSSFLEARFLKRFPGGACIRSNFEQSAGQFSITVLFGPSGCGKTTILRCLAGLEQPEEGEITFAGQKWFDSRAGIQRATQVRGVGYLFQEYALFPHRKVVDNISFGLRKLPAQERRSRTVEVMELLGLGGLEHRYPDQISGGQQQRVALARAIVCRPRLLLLDEPLSALDSGLRDALRWELRRLLSDFGIPVVMVTHDRAEAIAMADQVIVLDEGKILQRGSVQEVFTRPSDLAVARIVGVETIVTARVISVEEGLARIDVGGVGLLAVAPEHLDGETFACIRAEDVAIQREPSVSVSVRNQIRARITKISPEGAMVRIGLECGFPLMSLVTRPACEELGLKEGDEVYALVKTPAVHLVPRARGLESRNNPGDPG